MVYCSGYDFCGPDWRATVAELFNRSGFAVTVNDVVGFKNRSEKSSCRVQLPSTQDAIKAVAVMHGMAVDIRPGVQGGFRGTKHNLYVRVI